MNRRRQTDRTGPAPPFAPATSADPLPQALILTAIVISFSVLAFALALLHRTFKISAAEDVDQLRSTE